MIKTSKAIDVKTLIFKVLGLVQEGDNLFEAIDDEIVMFLIDNQFIIMDPTVTEGMDGTALTQKGMQYLRDFKAA